MPRNVICFFLAILFSPAIIVAQTGPAHTGQAKTVFNQGMQAFNAQDYPLALQMFMQARELGLNNKRLPYNIGVTYYKLKNYQAAYDELQQASQDPQLADLAFFNMGLAAYKMQKTGLAIENFKTSLRLATTPQQRRLSTRMLNKLGAKVEGAGAKRVDAVLKAGAGYNDNVTLSAIEDVVLRTGKADVFGTLYANASIALGSGWFTSAGLCGVNYRDIHDYNYHAINAAFGHPAVASHSSFELYVRAFTSYFGGDPFQNNINVRIGRQTMLSSKYTIGVQYQFNQYQSRNKTYDYLQGTMQQLNMYSKIQLNRGNLHLFYIVEDNRRDDFHSNGLFSSYSPLRQTLGFTQQTKLTTRALFEWGWQYRRSDYPDQNILAAGPPIKREDSRNLASVRFYYPVRDKVWLSVEYEYLNNESNIHDYNYRANNYSLNVTYRN